MTYQPEHIDRVWGEIRPFIERGLERGSTWNIDEIYEGLKSSDLQCWTAQNGALEAVLITALIKGDFCVLLVLSGQNMGKWLHCIESVEAWAKTHQCQRMLIHGRKGWSRMLGYEITGRDELGLAIMSKGL